MAQDFSDLLIYIPDKETFIIISEGTGDNLLREDYKNGYQDYILYDIFDTSDIFDRLDLNDITGGMIMYRHLIQAKYKNLVELVPDVLEDVFDSRSLSFYVLARN